MLGWDPATLISRGREPLGGSEVEAFFALVERRRERRPLQHLVGTQAFWRHEFLVTPDVLIPRPETELLVEHGLLALAGRTGPVIVDVGTGSGCVALSLAAERPDADVHATDLSRVALAVACRNAERLGLAPRVAFHEGDLLEPVAALSGRVSLVVSNPPYVLASDLPGLAPEVRDHEPKMALVPSTTPEDLYGRLFAQAAAMLAPEGVVLAEMGLGQEGLVTGQAQAAGLRVFSVVADLAGLPRMVQARRETP